MAAVLLYVCSTFVVWMCCFTTHSLAEYLNCPTSCNCLKSHASCIDTGLVNIPGDIPSWITTLDLQQNAIAEIRPADFKGLDNIEVLNLGNNRIKHINCSVFEDLTALRVLNLERNLLQEIPLFPRTSGIKELHLAYNNIVKIPILALQRMPNLTTLDLSHNYILSITNGTFPAGCMLTLLNLNNNHIAVLEKGGLGNLTELQTLRMSKNKLRELPVSAFQALKELRMLELMKNKISSIRGLTFQGMKQLHTLKLKKNNISKLETAAFFSLDSLVKLQLGHNKVKAIQKGWMYGLKSLKTLSLPRNKISEIDPKAWMCRQLEKLDLSHNQLRAITRETLAPLKQLRQLVLDHNRISRIDTRAFSELRKLNTLELNHNEISWSMEDGSGVFQSLSRLSRLGLEANGISSISVHAFSGLQQLRELNLGDNDITAIQLNAFETLHNLERLTFNSSKLSCDCHLAWLPKWLKDNRFNYHATGSCFHPQLLKGMHLYKVEIEEECSDGEFPKPVILESPRSTIGYKGENMSLVCVAGVTGNSKPTIIWKKDNEWLPETMFDVTAARDGDVNRYTSTLYLRNMKDSTGGEYQCVVSNDFGRAFSQKAYITVYVYPVFTEEPADVTVKAGKNAELKCAASGQPTPTISWQKDGGDSFPAARERRMRVYPDDSHFYILNVQAADQGVYSCKAENDAGTVISNATVTVLETPDFVKPMQRKKSTRKGETSVLQCLASGSPQPKLSWLKDGVSLVMTPRHFFTVDNQILVIVDTQWTDAGVYSCRISNSLGTAKGTTQLQVLSTSGEAVEASSSSFGLDDKSTTTGIIIIAVVCCVVGTSLVWVIIIYQTRKRHEMYSAAPSDETTLPGEVPSSGYMSSDREGSYSQGPLTMTGYHYQDYQMKESGYESSSGQFRVRPAIYPTGVDEDEPVPRMTAGDRLLRQMAEANSAGSYRYAASDDGDSLGSGNSVTSGTSGQHSSHSSSHMGHHADHSHSGTTAELDHLVRAGDELGEPANCNGEESAGGGRASLPDRRPLLQTFHPRKHASSSSSQERFHANTLDGVGYKSGGGYRGLASPQRRALSRDAVASTEMEGDDDEGAGVGENGFRARTHSDSCDKRLGVPYQYHPVSLDCGDSPTHCTGCACRHGVGGQQHTGGRLTPHEIHREEDLRNCNHPGCGQSRDRHGGSICPQHGGRSSSNNINGNGRSYTSSSSSPLLPPSPTPALHTRPSHHCQQPPQQTSGRPRHRGGHVNSTSKTGSSSSSKKSKKHQHRGCDASSACDCEHDAGSAAQDSAAVHGGRGGPPCCCEVMRDSRFCTTCSCSPAHCRAGQEGGQLEDPEALSQCCHHCGHQSAVPQSPHKHSQSNGLAAGVAARGHGRSTPSGLGHSDCEGCNCEKKSPSKHHQCTSYSNEPHQPETESGSRPSPSAPPPYPYSAPPPPYIPPHDRPSVTSAACRSTSTIPASPPPKNSSSSSSNKNSPLKPNKSATENRTIDL